MKIIILDRAVGHIRDGSWFYEKQGRSLGSYFRTSILDDIKRLKKTAGIHRVVLGKYHRCISRRFPFAIYYRTERDQVWSTPSSILADTLTGSDNS